MKQVNIGIIGFGTVGAGVAEALLKNGELISKRMGFFPVLRRVADLDTTTDRGVKLPDGVLINDAKQLVDDPEINIVVELVGGTTFAKDIILRAIRNGKSIVTANKALLATYGQELSPTFTRPPLYHAPTSARVYSTSAKLLPPPSPGSATRSGNPRTSPDHWSPCPLIANT